MVTKPGSSPGGSSEGPATDASNTPVVDPTANVFALVNAEAKRQDELRTSESHHVRELMALRSTFDQERAENAKALREAEAKRIDAIRAVDVQAAQQQTAQAETRAAVLAKTVTDSAEALRTQVQQAQVAATANLATALEPVQRAIAELRQVQYEQAGSKASQVEARTDKQNNTGLILGVAAGIAAYLSIAVGIILAVTR